MNVLVTGAGGFIGSHTARALSAQGWSVTAAIHRNLPPALHNIRGVEIIRADLASATALPLSAPCDAIVHCAAALPSTVTDEDELFRRNVDSMQNLLAFASSAKTRLIINCSSMAAFGTIDAEVVTPELAPNNPGSYGRAKLEGEHLLAAYAAETGARTLSIRLPGVVGNGSHDNFLSNVVAAIRTHRPIVARNPDALFNNIVHIDDLTGFFINLADNLATGHTLTTISADEPMTIKDVVTQLCAAIPNKTPISYEDGGTPFLISPEPARKLGYRVPTVRDSIDRVARDCLSEVSSEVLHL